MSDARRSAAGAEPLLAEARRQAIVEILHTTGSISVTEIQNQLGISAMTARRDLNELSRRGVLRRTHGGAVTPSISAHEDSFAQRLTADPDAKRALARAAVELVAPDDSLFLDSSSTSFFVAQEILERGIPVTVVTNSLPIMQLAAAQAGSKFELVGAGGALRPLTQSFVGPQTVRAISNHFTDRVFMSVKALAQDGSLTDPDALEAEVKRAMMTQAGEVVLLIDRSKLFGRGLNTIGPIAGVSLVIAYGLQPADLRRLTSLEVAVRAIGESPRAAHATSPQ